MSTKKSTCLYILDSWIYDNLITDELLPKVLRSFEICLSLSNNLCRKLVSSLVLPIIFHDSFRVIPASIFVDDFNILSYELDNFTFTLLFTLFYIDIISKQNKYKKHITFIILLLFLKSKIIIFTSSRMKNFVVLPLRSSFSVKLIVVLFLDRHHALVVYLNLLQFDCSFLWNKGNLVENQICNHLLHQ